MILSLERSLSRKEKKLCDLVLTDLGKAKKGLNSTYEGALPAQPVPLIITGMNITHKSQFIRKQRPYGFYIDNIEFRYDIMI